MDNAVLHGGDLFKDLESGWAPIENDREAKKVVGSVWNCIMPCDELPVKGEGSIRSCPTEVSGDSTAQTSLIAREAVKEKQKKKSYNKSSKPPRPPNPPQLDAADHKLIKEISELAMLKKARTERLKALKKMRAAKSSSSGSNVCAMVVTIVFCLVILLQGAFTSSRPSLSSHGSPEPAVGSGGGGFISVQYYRNTSAGGVLSPTSESPNIVDQVTGSDEGKPGISGRFRKLK